MMTRDRVPTPKHLHQLRKYKIHYELPGSSQRAPARGQFTDTFLRLGWLDEEHEDQYTFWREQPPLACGDITAMFEAD